MRNLSLKVNDFRAIKEADLSLNGITVISGVNSTGKSTLSKLLYYIVKLTLDFESKVSSRVIARYDRTIFTLSRLLSDFNISLPEESNMFQEWKMLKKDKNLELFKAREFIMYYIDNVLQAFLKRRSEYSVAELTRIFNALMSTETPTVTQTPRELSLFDKDTITKLFEDLKDSLDKWHQIAIVSINNRPLHFYNTYLGRYFNDLKDTSFSFSEDMMPIIEHNRGRLNNIYTIEQVFYIDTPMSLQISGSEHMTNSDYWKHLRDSIKNSQRSNLYQSEQNIFSSISEIIAGEASVFNSEISQDFVYRRQDDGLIIELADSATGIKAFSILQMLLSHDLLNEKTLLIIDEPEAHLHPQWIVEYARIIILLNKHLGVRFMLASHNPDMVSSLRYIAEKEETLSNINFYLAEEAEDNQYNFRNLGDDINPIFKSFNIAFDKMRNYGV